MVKRDLDRVDYPLEYLYFEFENWDDHKLFLETNHKHWTKYLTQFPSFQSLDVLICNETQQMTRLIIWDSYQSWKEITPGDVAAVDVSHRKEFPHVYERKSQMFATDKHPYNLVSRKFRNPEEILKYQNGLAEDVLKFSISFNKSGFTENFIKEFDNNLNDLYTRQEFTNRDIYVNKFDPKLIDVYIYLNGNEKIFDEYCMHVKNYLEGSEYIDNYENTKYGYFIREALFMND